ncbi:omptin family outer membrane protease [Chitinophaga agrisoli]|uniref:Omptin family outer membrane protease n=1 Tax=Chitinophaga agrisoli TaxID=2607653 RepID=A0A5B2VMI3_9BACT|nr:omptin family outer membrane protease [Chitinophaga agrisoli]KAA2239379.1 omptin family outer membrane protease [Chitinophaga agrisoli]
MRCLLSAAVIMFSVGIAKAQDHTPLLEFAPSGGYQFTDLHWSIAGNTSGQSPNVLSEVKWRKLSGPLFNGRLQLNLHERLFIGGELAICQVRSGTATDLDYAGDDRQQPTYNVQFDSDEGHTNAYRFYGGYNLLVNKKYRLDVFAGYAINKEFLFLLKHDEYVPGQRNLRSTYHTSWKGISGGLSGFYQITPRLQVAGELQYSQLNYTASADWNLVAAFQHPVSFRQHAKGFDIKTSLSAIYRLNRWLSLSVAGAYSHAETGSGIDELFLDSGDIQTTRFNGAFRYVKTITAGMLIQL